MEALNQNERKFAEEHHTLMDRRAVFERLEENSEALCLGINKKQKGESSVMGKVKVWIEHEDGYRQELSGDTVICFTVSKAGEVLDGKTQVIDAQTAFIGAEIPDLVFPKTIGSLVASTVEKSSGGRAMAGFNLHGIAQILEAKSREIRNGLTASEKNEAMGDAFKRFFESVLSR